MYTVGHRAGINQRRYMRLALGDRLDNACSGIGRAYVSTKWSSCVCRRPRTLEHMVKGERSTRDAVYRDSIRLNTDRGRRAALVALDDVASHWRESSSDLWYRGCEPSAADRRLPLDGPKSQLLALLIRRQLHHSHGHAGCPPPCTADLPLQGTTYLYKR